MFTNLVLPSVTGGSAVQRALGGARSVSGFSCRWRATTVLGRCSTAGRFRLMAPVDGQIERGDVEHGVADERAENGRHADRGTACCFPIAGASYPFRCEKSIRAITASGDRLISLYASTARSEREPTESGACRSTLAAATDMRARPRHFGDRGGPASLLLETVDENVRTGSWRHACWVRNREFLSLLGRFRV